MTRQIAVRLPEETVAFIDAQVETGQAPSRAAVVSRALDRERRRQRAQRDADILAGTTRGEDLDALADFAARLPIDDLE